MLNLIGITIRCYRLSYTKDTNTSEPVFIALGL